MRLKPKVILGFILGIFVSLLIVHWQLSSSYTDFTGQWWMKVDGFVDKNSQQRIENILTADVYGTGSFQRLTKDTYIYSAFIVGQEIRVIVLSGSHYQPIIVCHYCGDRLSSCGCPSQNALYYTNNENHGKSYGGFIASCPIPSCFTSRYFIGLSAKGESNQIQIPLLSTATINIKYDYTICTPPLRGQGEQFVYQLAEFIELSLRLGANHVTFYEEEIDDKVKQLLSFYEQRHVVSVLTWNLPDHVTSHANQLWYHGQVLAVQDCLYRGKAISKFIAFNDIDEFIVPLKHRSVRHLLIDINSAQHCGYCFDSVIFSLNARMPGAHRRSKLRTQRINYRTSQTLPSWSKCIVDPRKVFEMGIHHVSKATNEHLTMVRVDKNKGLLFHYRTCSSAFGIGKVCGDLVVDDTMRRFSKKLRNKVERAINKIYNIHTDGKILKY